LNTVRQTQIQLLYPNSGAGGASILLRISKQPLQRHLLVASHASQGVA
jgi:hypothetical protein